MQVRSERRWLDPAASRWGLGDVAGGMLAAQALGAVAFSIVYSLTGWKDVGEVPMWVQALLQIPLWGGYVGAVVVAGRKGGGAVRDFGLAVQAVDVPIGVPIGVAMQLVVLPLLYLPILWLTGQTVEDLTAPARELSNKAQSPWSWVLFSLIVVVGAPIVEELFFRGLFLRSLQKAGMSDRWACVVCAAVFAAIHLEPLQTVGLFFAGLAFSMLAVRTGRLGASIFAHVGFNATTVVQLFLVYLAR